MLHANRAAAHLFHPHPQSTAQHARSPALITQIIIGASHVVRSYGLLVGGAIVGIGFLVRAWFVSEKGKRVWEGLILKTPLVGPLIAQFAMARFWCRMPLGTLLGAGRALGPGLECRPALHRQPDPGGRRRPVH